MTPKDEIRDRWRGDHAEALRLAQRIRERTVIFRRYAGELKYLPQAGIMGHVGHDLRDAAMALRELLAGVHALSARWDDEVAWLRSLDAHLPLDEVHRGHAAVREAARVTRAALDVFEAAALRPEPAALDAPYGHGAPRRVHPGAQCTWVAERADDLARELSSVTLHKENLVLRMK